MKPNPEPRWLVYTPTKVAGTYWHVFETRKQMRAFATLHNGKRKELRDTH